MNREEVESHPLARLAVRNRRGRYVGAAEFHRRFWNRGGGALAYDYEYNASQQSTVFLIYRPSKRHGERYRTITRLERRLRRKWFYSGRRPMGQCDFKRWLHYEASSERRDREEVVRQALARARAKGRREHLRYERSGGNWRALMEEI